MAVLILFVAGAVLIWYLGTKLTAKKPQIQNDGPKSTPEKRICEQCGSANLFIDKAGYSAGQGCLGALFLGPLGLLCGQSKANNLRITCIDCKHKTQL